MALIPVLALAQDAEPSNHSSHYVNGWFGKSFGLLGSEEVRVGGGIGYAVGRREPHFRWGKTRGQIVYEGYFDRTWGTSGYRLGRENTYAIGVLGYGRWFGPQDNAGRRVYFDAGWGFQYANRATRDLDLQWNSTPVFGIGEVLPAGGHDYTIGLRILHISNAGIREPNQGQNQFYLMLGLRY